MRRFDPSTTPAPVSIFGGRSRLAFDRLITRPTAIVHFGHRCSSLPWLNNYDQEPPDLFDCNLYIGIAFRFMPIARAIESFLFPQ
jgi:hypothetical protein